jgi:hypothetical protein
MRQTLRGRAACLLSEVIRVAPWAPNGP